MSGLMALAIMSFQRSRSRGADIISVTLPIPNQDFRLSSIFSLCLSLLLFLSSLPVVRKCSKPSLLITEPKNVACSFLIFCTNDLLVFCLLRYHLICFLRCPWYAQHSSQEPHYYRLQSSLSLLVCRPCLTPVHQDRLNLALKGFLSCLENYVVNREWQIYVLFNIGCSLVLLCVFQTN